MSQREIQDGSIKTGGYCHGETFEGIVRYLDQNPGLESLTIEECATKTMPPLPGTIRVLVVKHCKYLISVSALPGNLTELVFYRCEALLSLPAVLPESLLKFTLDDCENLIHGPVLPQHLLELTIELPKTLAYDPVYPESLLKLTIELPTSMEQMHALPGKLIYLCVKRSYGLKSLPDLPETLLWLLLLWCPELAGLPVLPPNLEKVTLDYCYLLGNNGFKVGGTNVFVVVPDRRHLSEDLLEEQRRRHTSCP
jgi:hypothetical protein